jgi:hypothetical protein
LRRLLALAWLVLCAGCGTNIKEMIRAETRQIPYAERVLAAAEPLGLQQPLLDAEAAKFEACDTIYTATRVRIFESEGLTFFDFMLSDARQLGAALYPVPSVERCRRAHKAYEGSLDAVADQLRRRGILVPEDPASYEPASS